jgi:hypothetical protein
VLSRKEPHWTPFFRCQRQPGDKTQLNHLNDATDERDSSISQTLKWPKLCESGLIDHSRASKMFKRAPLPT